MGGQHGVDREDALHAMLNYDARFPGFDVPRAGCTTRPDLWIGPQRDAVHRCWK